MQDHNKRHHLLYGAALLSGASVLIGPTQVFAQSAESNDQLQIGIAEIVVTANRREERGQDVPISITAFSPQRLEQQGIAKEQDLQASVPSLVVGQNGQGSRESNSITLRGQGATFQASPGVVVYLNEVPLPAGVSLSQQGGPGNYVDLESLQVLAGPQGTLFGRNTTGGAVLLVPKKPTDEFGGWIKGEFGNYDRTNVEGAINLPVNDKLAVRVVGAYHNRDGYTRDVVWNKDRDNEHWYSGRIGVLFRPSDGVSNYTMAYGGYSSNNGAGLIHRGYNIGGLLASSMCSDLPVGAVGNFSCDVYRAASAQAEQLGPRKTAYSVDVFSKNKTWGVSNTTDIELSDELTLRNIVSYQQMKLRYNYDDDATALQQHDVTPIDLPAPGVVILPGTNTPVTYLNQIERNGPAADNLRAWTEELQLQGRMLDGNLNWTVGGFYFNQKPRGMEGSRSVSYCPAAWTGLCQASRAYYGISTESKALYAQATLDLAVLSPSFASLRLTGGYRHTWDRISGFSTQFSDDTSQPGSVICSSTGQSVPESTAFDACEFSSLQRSNSPSWLLGVDYKITPDTMIYGKISHGYKSGGFNTFAVRFGQGTDPDTRTFLPEKVTTYEIGMKSDFRFGSVPLRFNVAAYSTDYKNSQRTAGDYNPNTGAAGARTLSADARIRGVEVEATMRPAPGIEIGGNFSYTDAKYKDYLYQSGSGTIACNGLVAPGGIANASCIPMQYVAPYIWGFHVGAEQPLGDDKGTLSLFVNYSHTSSQYTNAIDLPAASPGSMLEPYGVLSASLDWRGVAGSRFDLGLFGTNLTNNLYRISDMNAYSSFLFASSLYGEPRMYGIRLKYSFGGE